MKTKYLFLIIFINTCFVLAQNGINYKALIKDNSGNVVANQNITVQFTILQGAVNVYQETHNPTTDANGIIIVNIGEGTVYSGDYNTINWEIDAHFLNVLIDTGSGLTDMGTTQFMAVPYALSAANVSGLEALDEGNGVGYRLKDSNPIYYGNIGDRAVDLSYGGDTGYDAGQGAVGTGSVAMGQYTTANVGSVAMGYGSSATGQYATAMGSNTIASGPFSVAMGEASTASGISATAMGYNTAASGQAATAMGFETEASGENSTALGNATNAIGENSLAAGELTLAIGKTSTAIGNGINANGLLTTAIGRFNLGGGDPTTWVDTDPLFEIGNGTGFGDKSNALTVLKNGTITAPSYDISEITDDKALITKEFADANYSGGGSGATPTGLEALDEGNGIGWRLIGSNLDNYGNIGLNAKDLSYSDFTSSIYGATGDYAISMGYLTTASGLRSTAIGSVTTASVSNSTAMGYGTIADDLNSLVIGTFNDNINSTTTLFQVGNGTDISDKSNAFVIEKNGIITAPSFDIAEITDAKALITKEYLEANTSEASGLEAIDEGNGIGWRLKNVDTNDFYPRLGNNSIDISTFYGTEFDGGPPDYSNLILGAYSFQAGRTNLALGNYSVALGHISKAEGDYSITMGLETIASGEYSTAIGLGAKATGDSSIAIGEQTEASGFASTAFGNITLASGFSTTALGFETIADDQFSTVVGRLNDNTTTTSSLFQVGNGTSVGRSNAFTVYQSGNALLAGTLTQSSDRRLKKDIEDLNYGLSEILALSPKAYNWKNREQDYKSMGLIAQEVQSVIKELVHTADDENKTLSVSYTELIPVLIKAIQEQQVIIESQKLTISAQEQTNTEQSDLLQVLLDRVEALEKNTVLLSKQVLAKN
ncbi:tail fiber domain-containing protein [Xanthomarina gelatinilytica]|uniref:tail fiber domain-containing protein n=1 Tax=Xanthomarina gelatinilytica TaxID=1137281 RepID=UPI003511A983